MKISLVKEPQLKDEIIELLKKIVKNNGLDKSR